MHSPSIRSPSALRSAVRSILELAGVVIVRLLSRTSVHGAERVPDRGPFIIAGNHRAVMEIFLMLLVTRPHVEIIGSGDFPLDPRFRFLAHWYGYIPYRRGSVDGRALRRALGTLRRGGVVGIFPEGGIWTQGPKETQRGVAWLAAQSGAPVVPMGFGGIDQGVERLLRLQMPRFEIRVGEPLSFPHAAIRRGTLDAFSRIVMTRIDGLIPEWDRRGRPVPRRDEYELELEIESEEGGHRSRRVRDDRRARSLARFYHVPVLLSIFEVNLLRDVAAMRAWDEPRPADQVARAVRRILGYVRLRNPYLFTYRLGTDEGRCLEEALEELRDTLAALGTRRVRIVPVRRLEWPDGTTEERRAPASGT